MAVSASLRQAVRWFSAIPTPIVLGIGAALCSSERLANPVGRDTALTAVTVWGLIILAAVIYSAVFAVVLPVLARQSDRLALVAVGVIVVALVVAFIVVYPRYGLPTVGGFGDRDDALTIMWKALLSGDNPFDQKTYLGDQVSPLLGGVVLYAPFVAVTGSAGWGAPVLLVLATLAAWRLLSPRVLLLSGFVIVVNIGFLEDFLLGGDAFIVPLLLAVAIGLLCDARSPLIVAILAVVLGALAGSARANVVPVAVAAGLFALLQHRATTRRLALLVMTLGSLTLVGISWVWAGGSSAWPFTGDLTPALRHAISALLVVALVGAGVRWQRSRTSTPCVDLAKGTALLGFSIVPLVVVPAALFRLWPTVVLVLPLLLRRYADQVGSRDRFDSLVN